MTRGGGELSGSSSSSGSDSRGDNRDRRRRRHDSSDDDSSDSEGSGGSQWRRRDYDKHSKPRDGSKKSSKKAKKKAEKKLKKEMKRLRKQEKKDAKRDAKRARRAEDRTREEPCSGDALNIPEQTEHRAGLEIRSREVVEMERRTREAEERAAREVAVAEEKTKAAEEEVKTEEPNNTEELATTEAVPADTATLDAALPSPPPPAGAAMTLEQYRTMAAAKTYMQGTTHATSHDSRKEETDGSDNNTKGWWACTSYKCGKRGTSVLNPKLADRCKACNSMKPLNAGAEVFKHQMSDAQYLANQSRRRGK